MGAKFGLGLVLSGVVLASLSVVPSAFAQSTTQTFDYQGLINLGLAPETPEETQECIEDETAGDATQTQMNGTSSDPSTLLNTSNELDQTQEKCGALTAAAVGTTGYIADQSRTSSVGTVALLGGAVALGGALALMSNEPSPSDPIPFPIPGAGLLSYLLLGGSGMALWVRRRLKSAKDNVSEALNGEARIKATNPLSAA